MFKKQVTICAVLFILLSFAGCAKGFERNSVIAAAKKDGMRSITLAGYEKLCQGGTFYEDVEKPITYIINMLVWKKMTMSH